MTNFYSSYDGQNMIDLGSSINEHFHTSLATVDGSPFAVGGEFNHSNQAEIYNIQSGSWREVANYPFHD